MYIKINKLEKLLCYKAKKPDTVQYNLENVGFLLTKGIASHDKVHTKKICAVRDTVPFHSLMLCVY